MRFNITKDAAYKHPKNAGLNNLLKNIFNNKYLNVKEKEKDFENELLSSISDAKKEWNEANLRFELADSQELVDYYTYKIKACQIRYEYFLKKAKEKGLQIPLECL